MSKIEIHELPPGQYIASDASTCYEDSGIWEEVLKAHQRSEGDSPVFRYDGHTHIHFKAEHVESGDWVYYIESGTFGLTPIQHVQVDLAELLETEEGDDEDPPRRAAYLIDSPDDPVRVMRVRDELTVIGFISFDLSSPEGGTDGDWGSSDS